MKRILSLVLAILMLSGLATVLSACGDSTKTYKLDDCIDVTFDGYDGYGNALIDFNDNVDKINEELTKRLQKKLGITTLFVTHDQEECFSISDKVAIMNQGVIEQYDSPEHIYKRPATEFVARFIGFENFLELSHVAGHRYKAADESHFEIEMDFDGEDFMGTIRPDDIRLAEDGQTGNVITGTVGVRTFLGKSYQYEVNTAAGVLKVNTDTEKSFAEGETIRLYLPADKLILVRR